MLEASELIASELAVFITPNKDLEHGAALYIDEL
jgi:hypothetical protein